MTTMTEIFGEPIHTYTREEAIEDGTLRDASTLAREYGIRWPVALTAAAWDAFVAWDIDSGCQDETGRLWDVLTILRCNIEKAINQANESGEPVTRIETYVMVVSKDNPTGAPVKEPMSIVLSPSTDGAGEWTILLPTED